jgi:hypothetical protein
MGVHGARDVISGLGAFGFSSLVRRVFPAPGGFVGYRTTSVLLVTLLSHFAGPGASTVTFFKIFLSFSLFVCMAVAVLYFFGKLVVELFGILDGRAPRPNDRYARN